MLSDRERSALTQLEHDLRESDPRWAASMARRRRSAVRLGLAAVLLVVGLAGLVGGDILAGRMAIPGTALAVAGFVLMVGATWMLGFGSSSLPAVLRSLRRGGRTPTDTHSRLR
ncbi:Protein of unknown function [Nakamurella panacisegetis]|uniref:DUF3040 domain-containing protein n=1 Tax=Nakamurella panacisegetis TaxID=1090615 RepID=A0A1H0SW36_9ACTN|nr:DUF3040 domain-containing protein [Nakamurella panacisegetis]SDP45874.1 Protein of unknown function [Nakamurella panacisegetis]